MGLPVVVKTSATALTIVLLLLSFGGAALAERPDMKLVDTVVGSYTMDGTTVYFVSHATGIMRWIAEPTDYVEWEGQQIPVDGTLRIVSCGLEHKRFFSDDSRVSISSSSSSYVGTFEVMPTPPEIPGLPPYMPTPKDGTMNTFTVMKKGGELGASKYHTIVKYADFVPETILEKVLPPPTPRGKLLALMTGTIGDYGLDDDGDSLYDYLVVSVEVSVRVSGFYTVSIFGLLDNSHSMINVYGSNSLYLGRGTHFVDVLLTGSSIYVSAIDPSMVSSIDLLDEYYNLLQSMYETPLSREYSFKEFERPPASLTDVIYDEGIDNDGDGTFDYLRIGVEVEVLGAGFYTVEASGLRDIYYNYVNVWNVTSAFLDVGTHVVNLDFNGPTIYSSGIVDASFVTSIALRDEYFNLTLDFAYDVPLSKEYDYIEFDPPGAHLTGIIIDQGIDTDDPSDGTFDYLEIGVQIEVSEAETYIVQVNELLDEEYRSILIGGSNVTYLDVGTQFVYVPLDGPTIYKQGLNPSGVFSITLFDKDFNYVEGIHIIPLTRTYLYTEFDSAP